ncbi:MAG: F-type H+-transporting ATPase subunit delta [Pseudonocardiales bacterium]|jgi:F-type H+-transporting ATPase subunit delta|nr:F-type H+-transporting ATPase subunit delta [Pseudonocardiales bacterium]
MAQMLQSASRDALAEAADRLDSYIDSASASDLARLGDDLFAVLRLLSEEPGLRRALADPATPAAARSALADRLFNGKISRPALDLVSDLVSSRWSRTGDLLEALEVLARRATLGVAEKDGTLESVEDELFRFGRILDREPQLGSLLADQNTPADKRVELLRSVLGGKVSPVTETLLEQTVRTPRGRNLDVAAEELSELAAARRDRYVAHVRTPVRLTAEQEQRLADSLSRLYNRPISLQVELDPSLLGGLVVQVGGELIDGSVSGKLAAARRRLPG